MPNLLAIFIIQNTHIVIFECGFMTIHTAFLKHMTFFTMEFGLIPATQEMKYLCTEEGAKSRCYDSKLL